MISKKVASILLASLLVLSSSMLFNTAMAYDYPPLPLLALKVPSPGVIEVWLMGEGETDLDAWWDIGGVDIEVHFSPGSVIVPNDPFVTIIPDPDYWFESFWPYGRQDLLIEGTDLHEDYVRVAFVGLSDAGMHYPVYGQGRLLVLYATALDINVADFELRNPNPRPNIDPWGSDFFPVDVAGFPHQERGMSPWYGLKKAPPLPHLVTVQGLPVAAFTESTHAPLPYEVIYLDASGSSADVPIVSYEWDFNSDGVVDATGVTASTYYTQFGFYEITLKVTDNAGGIDTVSAIKMVNVLQNADAEHRRFKVLSDEDGFNTLTVTARNFGAVSAQVKSKFTTVDKETGAELGVLESAEATLMAGTRVYLSADWDPYAYGWTTGTEARYDVRVELSFFDGNAWITAETFKLGLAVTD